jgi:hypothetical protein
VEEIFDTAPDGKNVFSYSCIHVRAFFKNSSIEGGVLRKIDLTRRW